MASEVPASPCGGSHENGDQSPRSNVHELDRFLPIANISRIMKKALPRNGKTTKDAKETMQECVSEFIGFITSEASDMCQREKRKTISGDDLLRAMVTLGFEDYIKPLRLYLHKYRQIEGDGKGSAKGAESSGNRDAGGFQGGNLSGSSMQGDMKMLQQDSFTEEGMSYMNTQVAYLRFSVLTLLNEPYQPIEQLRVHLVGLLVIKLVVKLLIESYIMKHFETYVLVETNGTYSGNSQALYWFSIFFLFFLST